MRRFDKTLKRKPVEGKMPSRPAVSAYTMDLISRPFRALSSVKPITMYIEPDKQATEAPTDYKFINRTNRVTEANYSGKLNSSGNILDRLPNDNGSIAMEYLDAGCMEISFKYQYLAMINSDRNQAANVQMTKSINEALARVASDTYTDLPFFKDDHTGSLPSCDSGTDPNHPKQYLGTLVWYQTFLQNIANIISRYQFMIANEDNLVHMGYNREAFTIVDLYGRFKKKAFQAKISSINHTIKSSYFDKAWWRQTGTITSNASRRADSIREPLLFVNGINEMPETLVTNSGVTIINSSEYKCVLESGKVPSTWVGAQVPFSTVIDHIVSMMSPYSILEWCRRYANGHISNSDFIKTPNDYFNLVNYLLDTVFAKLGKFSTETADIKTMLDVASRAGINRWELGVMLDFDMRAKYPICFNKLINDLYKCTFASDHAIAFDEKTQRWTFRTLWDEYLGIPEFDKINGGAFLTFSCHDIPVIAGVTDLRNLLPVMFRNNISTSNATAYFCNRLGERVTMERMAYMFNSSVATNRLKLLADITFNTIVMPFINLYNRATINKSCVLYLLTTLFGYGGYTLRDPSTVDADHPYVDSDIKDIQVLPSLIGFVDVELEDVTNDMIAYYQVYAPLKVYSSTLERTMGFTDTPKFQ